MRFSYIPFEIFTLGYVQLSHVQLNIKYNKIKYIINV